MFVKQTKQVQVFSVLWMETKNSLASVNADTLNNNIFIDVIEKYIEVSCKDSNIALVKVFNVSV